MISMNWAGRAKSLFDAIVQRPLAASLALLMLMALINVPGLIRLPAVDRTEVIYAETTREMVARGQWADPRYGTVVHQFRPIGTFWLQGLAASAAGPEHARDITIYRLPSFFAVTFAVLALYWLALPLAGSRAALLAASLFAAAPLTVLVAHLAIADGIALLPATVAMLALLRIYCAPGGEQPTALALILWIAVGCGMILNALQTPILIAATLIALVLMDRDVSWLRLTRPLLGVPIALLIASPWLMVRAYQDGVPFSGMSFANVIEALGGSQDMKLRAFPGTFVLAMLLGFLPGTALLVPAMQRLWSERHDRLARFLVAWIAGYLVYLEALSAKPGTYTVQVMFPALSLAVALLVTSHDNRSGPPRWHAIPWPPLAALSALAIFAGIYGFARAMPAPGAIVLIGAVAALFALSAEAGRAGRLLRWWVSGVAALSLFAVTLIAVVLPSIDGLWPARQIERALASCGPKGAVGLLGFREPSSRFLLGADPALQTPDAIAARRPPLDIVERRWLRRYTDALSANGSIAGGKIGCIDAYNTMRGCRLNFTIFSNEMSGACTGGGSLTCLSDNGGGADPVCD